MDNFNYLLDFDVYYFTNFNRFNFMDQANGYSGYDVMGVVRYINFSVMENFNVCYQDDYCTPYFVYNFLQLIKDQSSRCLYIVFSFRNCLFGCLLDRTYKTFFLLMIEIYL